MFLLLELEDDQERKDGVHAAGPCMAHLNVTMHDARLV